MTMVVRQFFREVIYTKVLLKHEVHQQANFALCVEYCV